ncbi:hypothetical protein GIB67_034244 [Kingdonia uniflora]|uniref:Uncharacterized protein n=1 Tax=Kingdonia uniflora TaxID=39325 RepID=A0A7J7NSA0_9MAGN|nr:hypothetical protein GIB67_034244 [Kingdonia uniflora]
MGRIHPKIAKKYQLNEVAAQDIRFPGRGRTLASGQNQAASAVNSDLSLHTRLLDNSAPDQETTTARVGQRISDGRYYKQSYKLCY